MREIRDGVWSDGVFLYKFQGGFVPLSIAEYERHTAWERERDERMERLRRPSDVNYARFA